MSDHPFIEVLTKLQYDLTSIQARLTDLKRNLSLELPAAVSEHLCPDCGLDLRGKLRLAEHVFLAHEGPEPEHWKRAEELAADDSPEFFEGTLADGIE